MLPRSIIPTRLLQSLRLVRQWVSALVVMLCMASLGFGATPAISLASLLGGAPCEETDSDEELRIDANQRVRVRHCGQVATQRPAASLTARDHSGHVGNAPRPEPLTPVHLIGSGIQLRQ